MFFLQQKWWKDYFSFSKKERIGIIVLLVLIGFLFVLPNFFTSSKKPVDIKVLQVGAIQISDTAKAIDNDESSGNNYAAYAEKEKPAEAVLFYFDPNTLDVAGWKRLGVHDKTITTIQNYIAKGGKFKTPQDIHRIYGLYKPLADKLEPFVQINAAPQKNFTEKIGTEKYVTSEKKLSTIEVNAADSNALIALPGIGSKLSQRIINFRHKLGGFYTVEQIAETFGLPDSTFQKIKPQLQVNPSTIKKINVNTATADELKQHPYIKWSLANAIVQYRLQHGPFAGINDLRQIALVNDDVFNKIVPYLTIN